MSKNRRLSLLVLSAALLSASACVQTPPPQTNPVADPVVNPLAASLEGAPQWVLGDCRDHFKEGQNTLCAVGSMSGTRSISMARSAATARARTELARSLQLTTKAMVKDYQSNISSTAQPDAIPLDEAMVEDVSKQITNQTLSGSRLQTSWVAPDGTLYALVSLELEAFMSALDEMKTLDDSIRKAIQARADNAFRELDEATATRR